MSANGKLCICRCLYINDRGFSEFFASNMPNKRKYLVVTHYIIITLYKYTIYLNPFSVIVIIQRRQWDIVIILLANGYNICNMRK